MGEWNRDTRWKPHLAPWILWLAARGCGPWTSLCKVVWGGEAWRIACSWGTGAMSGACLCRAACKPWSLSNARHPVWLPSLVPANSTPQYMHLRPYWPTSPVFSGSSLSWPVGSYLPSWSLWTSIWPLRCTCVACASVWECSERPALAS